jgi:hypothetical protein
MGETANRPSGALGTEWDSVRQRATVAGLAGGAAAGVPPEQLRDGERARLLGRLRWEVLLSGTVFLTFAQLLDGAAFHVLLPERLLDELGLRAVESGAALPLRVNAAGGDLDAQLVAMLGRGFLMSSLPVDDACRERVRHGLADQAAGGHAPVGAEAGGDGRDAEAGGGAGWGAEAGGAAGWGAEAASRLLAGTGALSPALCRRITARWHEWLLAAGRGKLEVTPASGADFAAAYALSPPPDPADLTTPAARDVLAAWRAGRFDMDGALLRSALHAATEPLLDAGDEAERGDRRLLRDDARLLREAADQAYYRAIALGEGCGLSRPVLRTEVSRRGVAAARQAPENAAVVRFPSAAVERLGLLTVDGWQRFTDRAEEALRRWWAADDPEALQSVADELAGCTRRPPAGAAGRDDATRVRRWLPGVAETVRETAIAAGLAAAPLALGSGAVVASGLGAAGVVTPKVVAAVVSGGRGRPGRFGRRDILELPWAPPPPPDPGAASTADTPEPPPVPEPPAG